MAEPREQEAKDHQFVEVVEEEVSANHLSLSDLAQVKLGLNVDLGSSLMLVRDVLGLKLGSVVTLEKLAGEMTDLYINDRLLGRGEVVVIGDTLHVRIGEIQGADEDSIYEED